MNQPSLDVLLDMVDSRYTLVVVSAKRARQLTELFQTNESELPGKPVTTALHELLRGKVRYRRLKAGIK
ncbi:DNA-directed RNA polymerase, omega subunit [Desulfofarcimen acetoxidans DSM 771]|jgi:DNA-directed RNA polymerase subunit omega|uniref:DNA-directed RNA polymerase subunit omega n=1 Tax=Desulfofarcimen acetoxidans (strain ATCC 49208 / DSM 771 / KCTC 5769 / VKM B-1644 / 5575) TaxID=485916 RepID=C8W075_DESAS|nr:DNA-directed RNA polymerase subunit omega [Desulfofarcimen acetoxidans]ACV63130.1 DNA-directed RNA polymerase, omega subunit [Desulfofarcimen acetoxidans DSM 771]